MPLNDAHVKAICKIGQGKQCCAFLLMSPEGFECAKGGSLEAEMQRRYENKTMGAQGNNCAGPPTFEILPFEIMPEMSNG